MARPLNPTTQVMWKLRKSEMVRIGLVLLFSSLCISSLNAGSLMQQPPVNARAEAMAAFQKRVDAYLALRNGIASKMPEVKETGDPAKISAREKALGQAIAMARRSAKAGDIFADLSPYLMKILADDWKSRSPADRQAVFEEVPPNLPLKVNEPYPTAIPLVTAPARLLAQLPTLPEALEYRLVDRRLLLRDRDANLIVDVLVGVQPTR
jgi:enoyl-CoA hydratase/carnithine racemase